MKIYAPVKDASGVYASVRFVKGVGETDDPHLIKWFKSHGYEIESSLEKCDEMHEFSLEKCDILHEKATLEPDFDSMTPNELRDYAKANGLGGVIKNTRNKEKLIELIRG